MSKKGKSSRISKLLDWIKDTLDRLKTLLIAAGAVIAAAVPVYKFLVSDSTPQQQDCYRLKVRPHEDTVSITRAKLRDMRWFDLEFKNDCKYTLFVRVEFTSIGSGGVVIGPIRPPDRWPGYTIEPGGELTKWVNPPALSLLMEKPQVIQILVSIYRDDNHELLWQDTSQIQMIT